MLRAPRGALNFSFASRHVERFALNGARTRISLTLIPGYELIRGYVLRVCETARYWTESLTIFAHFSTSAATSLANSAGEPASGVPQVRARRVFISESAKAALASLLSLARISAEMFLGAPIPVTALTS